MPGTWKFESFEKRKIETMFTDTLVYFFVRFASFCLEIVEWSGVTKKMNY